MALRKCRECGHQVSTSASACPNCGARLPKRTSIFTWIVLAIFAVFAIPALFSERRDSAQSVVASKPLLQPLVDPKREAIASLFLDNFVWRKGGFNAVMIVDVTLRNRGTRNVKDVVLHCETQANSGTVLNTNFVTIYEPIRAN